MTYGRKYIVEYENDLNEVHECFFEYSGYSGEVTKLLSGENGFSVKSVGADDDFRSFILGKEATINIWSDIGDTIDVSDFIAENDNDIRVSIFINKNYSDPIFQGFVVVEDNSRDFHDRPFALQIHATDTIGLLKDVPFTDLDGDAFVGFFSIVDIFAQIFYKASEILPFRTYFPVCESSMQRKYNVATADALREAFINVNMFDGANCYDVLNTLATRFNLRVFQQNGYWHLVNLLEYTSKRYDYVEYSFTTPLNGIATWQISGSGLNQTYHQLIGKNEIITPVNEDQVLYSKLANKSIKFTYNYDQSANKLCNQSMELGARLPQYDQVVDGDNTEGYTADCWTYVKTLPSSPPSQPCYNRAVLDTLGHIKDRYLVMVLNTGVIGSYYKNTSHFYVDAGDKLTFSVDFRIRGGATTAVNVPVMGILLYGDNGIKYTLNGLISPIGPTETPTLTWRDVTTLPSGFVFDAALFVESLPPIGQVFKDFTGLNLDYYLRNNLIPQIPVSGKVEVEFLNNDNFSTYHEYNFKSLQIEISPNINGAFSATGDYNFISQNKNIKQSIADTIEISDSPKRWFKGALLKKAPAPADYAICQPDWVRSDIVLDMHSRFTREMEHHIWFHNYKSCQKIEGTFRGYLTREYIMTGYLNLYIFTDEDQQKYYMLTSFEMDMAKGTWRGVFLECPDAQNPDNYTFDLIFDRNG